VAATYIRIDSNYLECHICEDISTEGRCNDYTYSMIGA
jgi:hypothetical protein